MNCKEVIEFLADYLDGSLPWWQRLVFKLHLAFCRECRAYLKSYRTTINVVTAEGAEAAAELESPPDALVQAILATRGQGKPQQ